MFDEEKEDGYYETVCIIPEAKMAEMALGLAPKTIPRVEAGLGFTFGLGQPRAAVRPRQGPGSIIVPLSVCTPWFSIPIAVVALGERISRRETVGIALDLFAVAALAREVG